MIPWEGKWRYITDDGLIGKVCIPGERERQGPKRRAVNFGCSPRS